MKWCAIGFALLLTLASGCAGGLGPFGGNEPLRLSALEGSGDATRQASLRLCVEGLDAEIAGRTRGVPASYELAIRLDPTNPYAYLALARHELEMGDPEQSLETLRRAEQLLGAEAALSPRVEVHLDAMRTVAVLDTSSDVEPRRLPHRDPPPAIQQESR